jgi:peptide/nickel transport system substrate-binding protein
MNTGETVQRLAADSGDDQSAVSWTPNNRGDAGQAAATSSRDSTGVGSAPLYLAINMSTVADLAVRQAIAHAVDKQAVINTRGSTTWVSTALSSITDPAHLGYQSYPDPYPHDADKARTLLAGKQLSLTLVIINNASREKQAGAIAQALGAVGITVTITKIGDPAGLRAALVKPETKWDLALIATGPSWPTAYRQLETMVDGRGGQSSTVNDAGVNARLDELDRLPVDQQNAQAALLDQKIMTELAPLVPIFFDQAHFIHGSRVNGVPVSTAYGLPDLATAYITTG